MDPVIEESSEIKEQMDYTTKQIQKINIDYKKQETKIILNYLLDHEPIDKLSRDYFLNNRKKYIKNRPKLINFIIKFLHKNMQDFQTLYHFIDSITFMDRFILYNEDINFDYIDDIACACMIIASNTTLDYKFTFEELSRVAPIKLDQYKMIELIFDILSFLNYEIADPNILNYLDLLINITNNKKLKDETNLIFSYNNTLMFNESYVCLSPIQQLSGLLYYLGLWTEQISIFLRKTASDAENYSNYISNLLQELYLRNNKYIKPYLNHINYIYTEDIKKYDIVIQTNPITKQSINYTMKESEFNLRYNDIKYISKGTFSTVYVANDNLLNDKVAMKVFNPDDMDKIENLYSIMNELIYLKYIENKQGLCDFYLFFAIINDVDEDIINYVLVMKFYDETIYEKFNELRKESDGKARFILKRYLKNIFEGERTLIHSGFTHADIKTSNILTKNSECVMSDFSLLRRYTNTTIRLAYTSITRSPEYIQNRNVNSMTEIWPLGYMIYFLFDGCRLLEAFNKEHFNDKPKSLDEIRRNVEFVTEIIKDSYHLIESFDRDLADLVSHMCCSIKERWTIDQCLKHQYFTI